MSEDSIASDAVSCRTDALLPPRKRLLAGLKLNGWSSNLVTKTVAPEDQESIEAEDIVSLQSLHCVTDKGKRKSDCHRTSSSLAMKKSIKKKRVFSEAKDSSTKAMPPLKDPDSTGMESLPGAEEKKVDVAEGKTARALEEKDVNVAMNVEGEGFSLAVPAVDLKPGRNPSSTVKEEEDATCKQSRSSDNKTKHGEDTVVSAGELLKPRRNPIRKHHGRNKDAEQKKQDSQRDRSSPAPLPLADEELARQLHRTINSSPRISRCLSYKEDRLPLS